MVMQLVIGGVVHPEPRKSFHSPCVEQEGGEAREVSVPCRRHAGPVCAVMVCAPGVLVTAIQ